jgi:hypothetical protein
VIVCGGEKSDSEEAIVWAVVLNLTQFYVVTCRSTTATDFAFSSSFETFRFDSILRIDFFREFTSLRHS